MKKTAIFLVFTLLLTMLGGMTTVWAANAPDIHETFEVDPENGLVIYGDQLTASPTMANAKDAYFNNTGTYRYAYFPAYSGWQWITYDLSVVEPGSYKVTARATTGSSDGKRGILELSRMNLNKTASGTSVSAYPADVVLSSSLVPAAGPYADVTVDLGIINLEQGVTTIGVKNIGNITMYLHNITLTPVDEDVIIRDRDDYYEAYGRTSNIIDKDGYRTHIFHKVINASTDPNPSYIVHKVYSPEETTYNLSYRYFQATQNSKINVEVGTVVDNFVPDDNEMIEDPLVIEESDNETIEYTTQITEAVFPNKVSNVQFYEIGQITLSKGYNYIKTTAAYGDFYLATMKLEEISTLPENAIELTDDSTTLLSVGSTSTDFKNNDFEFVVNADTPGYYDVIMTMYPSSLSYNEHRFLFTVNGEEQSYSGIKTDFSGTWKAVTIGKVYLPAGTSTLKITTLYAYGNNLEGKNEYVSVFNYMNIKLNKTETIINATTRSDASTTTNIFYKSTLENGIRFIPGNTAEYNISVNETGVYNLSIDALNKTFGSVWKLNVNGTEHIFETFSASDKLERIALDNVYLIKGSNSITLSLVNGTAVDVTSLVLSKDINAIKLYRDSVAVKNDINSVEYLRTIKSDKAFRSGKLVAQVDLSPYAGKDVFYALAVYNGNNQLVNVNCATVTATASTVKTIDVTGVTLEEGYKAKVFVWDNATLFGASEIF